MKADFVEELVNLEIKMQNLGALDEEDSDVGVFFLSTEYCISKKQPIRKAEHTHAALVA